MKQFTLAVLFGATMSFAACTAKQQASTAPSGKALLDAYVSAWNRHDSAAFDTLMTTDAVYTDVALGFKGTGPAETKAFMRDVISMEPDFDWHMTKVIEDGPNMAAEWTWTATYTGDSPSGPVTAKRISGVGSSHLETENGKIKRFTDYYDVASFFPKPATETTKK